MELDLVSGKEALSVEYKDDAIGQWENLLRKWEDEKTEKLKELALSDSCRQVDNDEDDGLVRQTSDEYEWIREADDHEALNAIVVGRQLPDSVNWRLTTMALQSDQANGGEALCRRSRHIHHPKSSECDGKAFSKRAKARYAKLDDKRELLTVEVRELRYSQPVVMQGDVPMWSISIAVGAGSLGSEGELVCALFAVNHFLDYGWKDQWTYPI